eukprot:TRINITY_DN15871_c0_g1_i1.p1 TRINITY_DN15871_c0_g1~~TRINITY_DN15871_c0_g1_i1.p1  ORF type:complete len:103 (-),score=11.85 TRINITY_DN15871_c0_g1_i1:183-491(-)
MPSSDPATYFIQTPKPSLLSTFSKVRAWCKLHKSAHVFGAVTFTSVFIYTKLFKIFTIKETPGLFSSTAFKSIGKASSVQGGSVSFSQLGLQERTAFGDPGF